MAGPVGHQRSGKGARVQVEGGNLRMASYETTERTDDLDTTNFESGGYEQGTVGIIGLDWSVRGPWDASTNNFDDPPGFYARDNLGLTKIFPSVTDNTFWNIPESRVLSSSNSAEVKGLVQMAASCKANGQGWSQPTGSI